MIYYTENIFKDSNLKYEVVYFCPMCGSSKLMVHIHGEIMCYRCGFRNKLEKFKKGYREVRDV